MYGVLVGKPVPENGLRFVEGINHFTNITDETRKYYLGKNPCSYENMKGEYHTCDRSEIVAFDVEDAKVVLGGVLYRVPLDKLREVEYGS